ncbi:MAG: phage tail sheath C-terminal domain-containing protein [Fusobacteriaceae bacterium]
MATNNGMPELEIAFKGLGVSAIKRGERGTAVLIIEDETILTSIEKYAKYKSISDFTSEEQEKYNEDNILYIKDALEGIPLELYVFKIKSTDTVTDILKTIGETVPRNCWIAIASPTQTNQNDLCTWIKAENKNNKKRYKGFIYKGTTTDDMHIVNFTTNKLIFNDERGEVTGDVAIPFFLGFLAGLPLTMSAIAKSLTKFISAEEPEELSESISNGEYILFNDEGVVKVARGVNSLVTLTQGVTLEMTQINTVEKMDLIYTDILNAWNNGYKGKYPNILNNQMLLISAINGYFKGLARDYILDPEFDNRSLVDIEAQRIANYPKYGEEAVNGWDDSKVMKMTVSTDVFLTSEIKISGIMESFFFDIFM